MSCDICGAKGTSLNALLEPYKTKDIQAICQECETIVNRKHSKLLTFVLAIHADLFKRFLKGMK